MVIWGMSARQTLKTMVHAALCVTATASGATSKHARLGHGVRPVCMLAYSHLSIHIHLHPYVFLSIPLQARPCSGLLLHWCYCLSRGASHPASVTKSVRASIHACLSTVSCAVLCRPQLSCVCLHHRPQLRLSLLSFLPSSPHTAVSFGINHPLDINPHNTTLCLLARLWPRVLLW